MFTTFVCATVLALLPLLPAHSAPVTPQAFAPPSGFSITSFGVNGSGCPPGSATYSFNGDKTAVNVTFSEFYASAGPGIPISENRKNCQLTFAISVPSGFSYGIASTEARGYYYLDPSVTASQQTYYYFQGQDNQVGARHNLIGPVPGAYYSYSSKVNLACNNFSPCGTSSVLNINTDVSANNNRNPSGSGFIATDATDASFSQVFNFAWQTC